MAISSTELMDLVNGLNGSGTKELTKRLNKFIQGVGKLQCPKDNYTKLIVPGLLSLMKKLASDKDKLAEPPLKLLQFIISLQTQLSRLVQDNPNYSLLPAMEDFLDETIDCFSHEILGIHWNWLKRRNIKEAIWQLDKDKLLQACRTQQERAKVARSYLNTEVEVIRFLLPNSNTKDTPGKIFDATLQQYFAAHLKLIQHSWPTSLEFWNNTVNKIKSWRQGKHELNHSSRTLLPLKHGFLLYERDKQKDCHFKYKSTHAQQFEKFKKEAHKALAIQMVNDIKFNRFLKQQNFLSPIFGNTNQANATQLAVLKLLLPAIYIDENAHDLDKTKNIDKYDDFILDYKPLELFKKLVYLYETQELPFKVFDIISVTALDAINKMVAIQFANIHNINTTTPEYFEQAIEFYRILPTECKHERKIAQRLVNSFGQQDLKEQQMIIMALVQKEFNAQTKSWFGGEPDPLLTKIIKLYLINPGHIDIIPRDYLGKENLMHYIKNRNNNLKDMWWASFRNRTQNHIIAIPKQVKTPDKEIKQPEEPASEQNYIKQAQTKNTETDKAHKDIIEQHKKELTRKINNLTKKIKNHGKMNEAEKIETLEIIINGNTELKKLANISNDIAKLHNERHEIFTPEEIQYLKKRIAMDRYHETRKTELDAIIKDPKSQLLYSVIQVGLRCRLSSYCVISAGEVAIRGGMRGKLGGGLSGAESLVSASVSVVGGIAGKMACLLGGMGNVVAAYGRQEVRHIAENLSDLSFDSAHADLLADSFAREMVKLLSGAYGDITPTTLNKIKHAKLKLLGQYIVELFFEVVPHHIDAEDRFKPMVQTIQKCVMLVLLSDPKFINNPSNNSLVQQVTGKNSLVQQVVDKINNLYDKQQEGNYLESNCTLVHPHTILCDQHTPAKYKSYIDSKPATQPQRTGKPLVGAVPTVGIRSFDDKLSTLERKLKQLDATITELTSWDKRRKQTPADTPQKKLLGKISNLKQKYSQAKTLEQQQWYKKEYYTLKGQFYTLKRQQAQHYLFSPGANKSKSQVNADGPVPRRLSF